jgi:PAS domain S-box-containing protein
LAASGLLLLVIGAVQALELRRAWDRALDDIRRQAASLVLVVEQDMTRALEAVDLSLLSVAEALDHAPGLRFSKAELANLLGSKLDHLPYVRSLTVFDRDGAIVASAPLPMPPDTVVEDQVYFRQRRADPGTSLVIHDPAFSQLTSQIFVPLTRRLEDERGGFAGIVLASLEPRALDEIYNALDLGTNGVLGLFKSDSTLLARFPHRAGLVGQKFADIGLFRDHVSKATAGVFIGGTGLDGIERAVAYRKLSRYPVVTAIGIDLVHARSAWHSLAKTAVVGFLVTGLAIAAATALLVRTLGEQRRLLAQTRASDQRFRDFAEVASDWLYEMDAQYRFTYISPRRQEVTGAPVESRLGRTPFDLAAPDELARYADTYARFRRALDAREEFRGFEFWSKSSGGTPHCVAINGRPIFDADGTFLGYRGTGTDLTERRRAERAAAELHAKLEDAIESLSDGFALFDRDDRLVLWNRTFSGYYGDPNFAKVGLDPRFAKAGLAFEDMIRAGLPNLKFPQEIGATPEEWMAERQRRHRNPSGPLEIERVNGNWDRVIESRTRDGGTVLIRTDITELKVRQRIAERLARQQNALAELSQLTLVAPSLETIKQRATELAAGGLAARLCVIWELEPDGRSYLASAGLGWKEGRVGQTRVDVGRNSECDLALATKGPIVVADLAAEARFRPSGLLSEHNATSGIIATIPCQPQPFGVLSVLAAEPRRFEDDEIRFVESVAYIVSTAIDHWNAERVRKVHEARLVGILNALPASVALVDQNGVIVEVNRHWAGHVRSNALFGGGFQVGTNYLAACRAVAGGLADAAASLAAGLGQVLAGTAGSSPPLEYPSEGDGQRSWYRAMISPLSTQSRDGAVVMHMDVTDRRAAEETLAQAQKLEAVGQLTGGIAHDFNNLLTVILGQSDLLSFDLAGDREHALMAETINTAARRGADLTRQLLAFARRQPLQPARVQINALVQSLLPILRRTLSAAIEVKTAFADDAWPCLADPAQLEAALLNLAINARDAMERSGVLTIETANAVLDEHYAAHNPDARPGEYAMIGVSDTGHGMSPEIMAHVFEPFFTTKPVGQGTGLGLSMVYGFVKQTGGHIKIYSEVGRGTTVKLYLPRAGQRDISAQPPPSAAPAIAAGTESVLLVEDDTLVREFTAAQLRRLGYRVSEASSGPAALAILSQGAAIDLLFTDIVIPGGLTGHELAAEARRLRPQLKLLFTSGYPAAALQNHGGNRRDAELIVKPYRVDELARRLREVLDRD